MTIAEYDHLDAAHKKHLLFQCCGSTAWVTKMLQAPPVEDLVDLLETAEENWYSCTQQDWSKAFEHHPKIGDLNSLQKKFATTAHFAASEQSGVETAGDDILQQLANGNTEYENKFGHIFIVCATGKSANEMLSLLKTRLPNTPEEEIKIAADEQLKITKLRLQKLFE